MKVKGGLRKKYFQTEEELRSSTEVIANQDYLEIPEDYLVTFTSNSKN